MGRSGDLFAQQPKAAGSSLLAQLAKYLALDAVQLSGFKNCKKTQVLPIATGMTLLMVFLALKQLRPPTAKYVVWSRIDQKSCFKSIMSAGLTPVVVELRRSDHDDGLETDTAAIERKVQELGAENVLAIFCTTSTFAPRVPDDVQGVSKIAKSFKIPLVVNNAYGLQCSKIMNDLELASRKGRLDMVIQSTDKNFMVPVGGSVIAIPNNAPYAEELLEKVSKCYPGRASGAPMLDLVITFLGMGRVGLKELWTERKTLFPWFKDSLSKMVASFGLRVLETRGNKISLCVDLTGLVGGRGAASSSGEGDEAQLNKLGAQLFNHRVSGPRVVACPAPEKSIDGFKFKNYGAHADDYPFPYLATACAIGATKEELEVFLGRLKKALTELGGGGCLVVGVGEGDGKRTVGGGGKAKEGTGGSEKSGSGTGTSGAAAEKLAGGVLTKEGGSSPQEGTTDSDGFHVVKGAEAE